MKEAKAHSSESGGRRRYDGSGIITGKVNMSSKFFAGLGQSSAKTLQVIDEVEENKKEEEANTTRQSVLSVPSAQPEVSRKSMLGKAKIGIGHDQIMEQSLNKQKPQTLSRQSIVSSKTAAAAAAEKPKVVKPSLGKQNVQNKIKNVLDGLSDSEGTDDDLDSDDGSD